MGKITTTAWILLLACIVLPGCSAPAPSALAPPQVDDVTRLRLFDAGRNRVIPLALYFNRTPENCSVESRCPVAILSQGEGRSNLDYGFVARALNDLNYLVVSIQHDLPSDTALVPTADAALARPLWQRGADNIRHVRAMLQDQYKTFDWNRLLLVGHGNGGDLSLWLAGQAPDIVAAVITLDHRRVPLPQTAQPRVLSVRASDTPPLAGVIPDVQVQAKYGMTIVPLANARHEDMHDGGPAPLQDTIVQHIRQFLAPTATAQGQAVPQANR